MKDSLRRLHATLQLVGRVEPYHNVLDRLAEASSRFPGLALECLLVLLLESPETDDTYWKDDEKRTIIKRALSDEDSEVVQRATDLVNQLCARGQFEYQVLLLPK